jgi:hypothetical protein
LAIIAACICAFLGIFFTVGFIRYRTSPYLISPYSAGVGIFGVLGFASGMAGGILTLKRRMFYLAMVGIALMLPEGLMVTIMGGWFFGAPVILLAVLGMFFIAMSRKEFTS